VRGSKVEVIAPADATVLARASAASRQLVWPGNAPDARVSVTRVTVARGGEQPRPAYADAQQIWIIEHDPAELLLTDDRSCPVEASEAARTPAGETDGLRNSGSEPFVFVTISTLPVDFRGAYEGAR
jgi:mannose-6-phosphate isomerase-like protein (cupin superfamily)